MNTFIARGRNKTLGCQFVFAINIHGSLSRIGHSKNPRSVVHGIIGFEANKIAKFATD